MGELFAALPSEQLDMIWTAADHHARAAKAAGDPSTLHQLRVAALVGWAESYLSHGDPTACDRLGHRSPAADDGAPMQTVDGLDDHDSPAGTHPPARHGRAASLRVLWDLSSLLGVTAHAGELAASGATLPPTAMRELLARGARIRRMLVDDTGEPQRGDVRDAALRLSARSVARWRHDRPPPAPSGEPPDRPRTRTLAA